MSTMPGGAPTRRRFIAIAAAAAGLPFAAVGARAETAHMHRWSGIALGAAAEIVLHDPDAAHPLRAEEADGGGAAAPVGAPRARAETAHMHRWSAIALGAAAEIARSAAPARDA